MKKGTLPEGVGYAVIAPVVVILPMNGEFDVNQR